MPPPSTDSILKGRFAGQGSASRKPGSVPSDRLTRFYPSIFATGWVPPPRHRLVSSQPS